MLRLTSLAALLSLAACDASVGKDRDSVTVSLEQADDGSFIGAFAIMATVGPVARELDPELTVRSKGFVTEGSSIEIGGLVGLTEVGSDQDADIAEFDFTPQFRQCDDAGYTEEPDGGCTVDVLVFVVTNDGVLSPTGTGILKVFEPDGYTGSTADLEVSVVVSNGN